MGAYDCDCINNLEYDRRERKAQLSKEGTTKDATSDLISRTETVKQLQGVLDVTVPITDYDGGYVDGVEVGISTVSTMPTIQPEPTDIDAKEAVYNLAEKIGIHQLFALTVELRGEPIQPEPQEGYWIPRGTPDGGVQYECSRCGVLWEFNDGTPEDNEAYFCPNCGAYMRGEQDEL